jgi:hypothetical protein
MHQIKVIYENQEKKNPLSMTEKEQQQQKVRERDKVNTYVIELLK